MPRAVGFIDGEPLLVAAASPSFAGEQSPGLPTVCRTPQVVAEKGEVNVRLKTKVEKLPDLIGVGDRVAPEDVILENAWERPVGAAVGRKTPSGLPEVGTNAVKLSPGDSHLATIRRVNGNGALVRSVAEDVLSTRIDVHLETGE